MAAFDYTHQIKCGRTTVMKSQLHHLFVLCLIFFGTACGTLLALDAPDWKKDPLLISIDKSAKGIMAEYQEWSENWAKSNRKPTEKDLVINRITEEFFITLQNALANAPNPELLNQSVRFLDTSVPVEFDDTWRFVFIEISNVAKTAEGRLLHSEHLENLQKRAMDSK